MRFKAASSCFFMFFLHLSSIYVTFAHEIQPK